MVQRSASDTKAHDDECVLALLDHVIKQMSFLVSSNMN